LGAWPLIIWEVTTAKRNYCRINWWCIAKNLGGYTLETRRRAARAESARIEAPIGVGFLWRGIPLRSRLRGLGERRELPQPPTHSRHISGPQKPSCRMHYGVELGRYRCFRSVSVFGILCGIFKSRCRYRCRYFKIPRYRYRHFFPTITIFPSLLVPSHARVSKQSATPVLLESL